jgi:hypothetical protein
MILAVLVVAPTIAAKTLWRGDFESGDLQQWHYQLNPQGLSLERDCVLEGKAAGLVTLAGSKDFLWNGHVDLNRSEFQYKPASNLIVEGKNTYFGWSFLLPEQLSDARHEIAYWESDRSYQQMFRFSVEGTQLNFEETKTGRVIFSQKEFARPGHWQDIALHIHWSTDPRKGFVRVWLNGVKQGRFFLKTLHAADESMFVQMGLLRRQTERVERIIIDNARHTTHRADLLGFVPAPPQPRCLKQQ